MQRIVIFAVVLLAAMVAFAEPTSTGSIKYSGGRMFETGVYRPKLLAEFEVSGGQPYLVFSGFGCDECDININIFIRSATDGPIERPELSVRHVYPGKYRTYDTNELVQTTRTFVGQCTPTKRLGVVWFLNTKFEDGVWRRSNYLAQLEEGKLVSHDEPDSKVTLRTAKAAVLRGVCREIPGKQLTTEP